MNLKIIFLTFLVLMFSVLNLHAADATPQQKIINSLSMLLPNVEPDIIEKTAVPGIYEVQFGPRLVYVSEDGRFLIQGSIIDLETRENLTEPRLMEAKIRAIETVGESNMLVYSPPESLKVKHQISVFTDIDCGYCRKLHREMEDYNNAGIEVRYLFYPRAGKGSESYNKAVNVWCAEDSHAAMDFAKAGKSFENNETCENPVDDHMVLGEMVGVTGTPAIVLSDGKLVPGYVPADRLSRLLEARAAN